MNIIQRNLFRLLRCGVFQTTETLEPMSVCKWDKLHQLAVLLDVQPYAYQGLLKCKNQFTLHMTDGQWGQWELTHARLEDLDDDELLRPDKLTNPILNRQLQNILDDETSDLQTRRVLIQIISIARRILNEGLPLRRLVELGVSLREQGPKADYTELAEWLRKLRFQQMAQLEAALLIDLLGFEPKDIPFVDTDINRKTAQVAQELAEYTAIHQDFYFSQGSDSIFVHTNNGSALFSHIRRSARYMRFIPSEAFTNFFASFAHSLTHIEE
ncbi:hypothetical protein [Prevotella sp. P6B1]|uniref:hypothetical protein n=1 Tax=Prevotella sp. P6B1 TaxID=1410613 RepID=UPI00051B9CCF|nr:hypothetical protein [Prevotella sp. P6B1]